jgi:hypothetical protein
VSLGMNKMRFFTKEESGVIVLILLLIGVVSFNNFRLALRRSRDSDRKQDAARVADALRFYKEDFGFYPPSSESGRIVACSKNGGQVEIDLEEKEMSLEEQLLGIFDPCEWGNDALKDITDPDYPPYMKGLPKDPQWEKGIKYIYRSNTKHFQLYVSLESDEEDEYNEDIVEYGVMCGERVCNFGKSSGAVPLDKSLEEYENELEQKNVTN